MVLLAYLVALAIVVVTWYHKRYYQRNKFLSKIPTIPSYPLIGSSLSFTGRSAVEMFQVLEKAARDYGSVWRFDLSPFHSNIVVTDPKLCEGILSSQKLLEKSVEYGFVRKWLNDGERRLRNWESFIQNFTTFQGFCYRPEKSGINGDAS